MLQYQDEYFDVLLDKFDWVIRENFAYKKWNQNGNVTKIVEANDTIQRESRVHYLYA